MTELELQQEILEEVAEHVRAVAEDPGEDEPHSFAEALKEWFDNQLQELHDSRGDDEYQQETVKLLHAFRTMIRQIKELDFGMAELEDAIAKETATCD